MAQQVCEVCHVLGQSSQMKKPMANCSSYIRVSQAMNSVVHFDYNGINPFLILHKTTY